MNTLQVIAARSPTSLPWRTSSALTGTTSVGRAYLGASYAVFTGPEQRSEDLSDAQREEFARKAVRNEVALHVDKHRFDAHARFLQSDDTMMMIL